MRYGADHKEKTRQRILDAAAVVFRRQGFQAGSVDDVMSEAGLTAGGFYAHFESKDDLFAAALVDTLRQARIVYGKDDEQLEGDERIASIAAKYLSPAHRKQVERGCAMPPLLADLPRQSPATRQAFEEGETESETGRGGGDAPQDRQGGFPDREAPFARWPKGPQP